MSSCGGALAGDGVGRRHGGCGHLRQQLAQRQAAVAADQQVRDVRVHRKVEGKRAGQSQPRLARCPALGCGSELLLKLPLVLARVDATVAAVGGSYGFPAGTPSTFNRVPSHCRDLKCRLRAPPVA